MSNNRRLIIDTNIFLLLVIGAVEEGRHISKSKRLNGYSYKDYLIVIDFIATFSEIYITHYIATEVSNLIDLKGHLSDTAFKIAQELFKECRQVDSDIHSDCNDKNFIHYGITDSSLINLVSEFVVLTNDNRLLAGLYGNGHDNVVPYNSIKELSYSI